MIAGAYCRNIQTVIENVKAQLEPEARLPPPDRIHAELKALEQQEARLTDAIALGGDLPALVAKLQAVQLACQALHTELQAVAAIPRPAVIDSRAMERATHARLADWRATLTSRIMPETKAFLKDLLEEPLTLTPVEGQRAVRFAARVRIGGILEGIVGGTTPRILGVPGSSSYIRIRSAAPLSPSRITQLSVPFDSYGLTAFSRSA